MEELMLKLHIEELRQKFRISSSFNDVPTVCNECDLLNMIFADLNGFGYVQIRLDHLGISSPYHKASLVGYNSETGPKWFLVDITYGQFFKNKKFNDYMYSRYSNFSDKLLSQGYIDFTIENMISYVDGFANSRAFTKVPNKETVLQIVHNFLLDNNIISDNNIKTRKKS